MLQTVKSIDGPSLSDGESNHTRASILVTDLPTHPAPPASASSAPATSGSAAALSGDLGVPGDKSISHRALMFGALAVGETTVTGLLEGEDVLATATALRQMGAAIERDDDGVWRIQGVGVGGLSEPSSVLNLGNSGTSARLLMGLLATHPFTAFMSGDASLSKRPMARVTGPLTQMGARFVARSQTRLPLAVTGTAAALPIEYTLPVASAQIKSAVLLAGLNTAGETRVIEPKPSRDHTERMLAHFGADVTVETGDDGGRLIRLTGHPELTPQNLTVPGDPSSAAFPLVAALMVPGSKVTVRNVGVNPLRIGLFDTLVDMGADLVFENQRISGGEPVADITATYGPLKAVTVPAARAPSMIDEYPILAMAASIAEGETVMDGLGELRVKESDRLDAISTGLSSCGVKVEAGEASLRVIGSGGKGVPGGALVASQMDHRLAMAFSVLGLVAKESITVDDVRPIDTSFPGFIQMMNAMGANITETAAGG